MVRRTDRSGNELDRSVVVLGKGSIRSKQATLNPPKIWSISNLLESVHI